MTMKQPSVGMAVTNTGATNGYNQEVGNHNVGTRHRQAVPSTVLTSGANTPKKFESVVTPSYVIVGQATPVMMHGTKRKRESSSFSCSCMMKMSLFIGIQIYMYYEYSYVILSNQYDGHQHASSQSSAATTTANQRQNLIEGRGSPIYVNNFYGLPPQSWGPLRVVESNETTGTTQLNPQVETRYACNNLKWDYYNPIQDSNVANSKNNDPEYQQFSFDDPLQSPLPVIQHKPMFVPSFPGSGAELFRTLIQALTGGIQGWSVYDDVEPPYYESCHSLYAITCKTHWPVLEQKSPRLEFFVKNYDPTVILLVRNPMAAFPSRLNHLWETNTRTKEHSTQAPERAWNRWISTTFDVQISKYYEFILSWLLQNHNKQNQNQTTIPVNGVPNPYSTTGGDVDETTAAAALITPSPYKVALFLPYEGLVNREDGPNWSHQVVRALRNAHVSRVISIADDEKDEVVSSNKENSSSISMINCLWKYTVVDKPTMKRSSHTYRPGYTIEQQSKLVKLMDDLIHVATTHKIPSLQTIFQQYRIDIQQKIRIVDEAYQTQHNRKRRRRRKNKNSNQNTNNTIEEEGDTAIEDELVFGDAEVN